MVVIGCKLPNGLICEMGRYGDDDFTRVVLNGSNSAKVVGGYGLTNVSKAFWEAWLTKHQRLDFVRKGLVFQHSDEASARSHATEMSGLRTGLEALDPTKPLAGTTDKVTGKPLVEVDTGHLMRGKAEIGQLNRAASR